jgi:hypothetical protein
MNGLFTPSANGPMNAVAAADSYARTTGRLGLATVTQGPGLAHNGPTARNVLDERLGDRVRILITIRPARIIAVASV